MIKKLLLLTFVALGSHASWAMETSFADIPKVTVTLSNAPAFKVPHYLLKHSKVINHMLEDTGSNQITIPTMTKADWYLIVPLLQNINNKADIKQHLATITTLKDLATIASLSDYLDIPVAFNAALDECVKRLTSSTYLALLKTDPQFLDHLNLNPTINFVLANRIMKTHPATQHILAQKQHKVQVLTLTGHTDSILSAAFNHAGDKVVTASEDNTACIWDVATGNIIRLFIGHTGSVLSAAFNHAGDKVVTASDDNTARIWDVATGNLIRMLTGHTDAVFSAAFNRAGDKVVTASEDNTARIWDVATGNLIRTLTGHTDAVFSAAFNHAGDKVVTASLDKNVYIWDITGNLSCILTNNGHRDGINSAAFNHAGNKVVTASDDHTARIWDATTGNLMRTLTGHTYHVTSAAFNHADDKIITASEDKTARIWDTTGNLIHILTGHTRRVYSAAFNRTGDKVITASEDKTARIWHIKDLMSLNHYLHTKLTLEQALVLVCEYEALQTGIAFNIKNYPHLIPHKLDLDTILNPNLNRRSSLMPFALGATATGVALAGILMAKYFFKK